MSQRFLREKIFHKQCMFSAFEEFFILSCCVFHISLTFLSIDYRVYSVITQYVILNAFFQRLFGSLNQTNNPQRGKMFIFSKESSITIWGFNRPEEIMEKLQESSVQQESSWGVYCFLLSYFVYLWVQFPKLFLKFLCLVQTDPCLHFTLSPVHN